MPIASSRRPSHAEPLAAAVRRSRARADPKSARPLRSGVVRLDQPFEDAVSLLLWPDHYILRLLFSQGVSLECLACASRQCTFETDRRAIWRRFAALPLFRARPHGFGSTMSSPMYLASSSAGAGNRQLLFRPISAALEKAAFRLARSSSASHRGSATTEAHLIRSSITPRSGVGLAGRVITTFRPMTSSTRTARFCHQFGALGELTGENASQ